VKRIWTCKIGESEFDHSGMDSPMREAVREAYKRVTGVEAEFLFSGWGGELTEPERAVVENRCPVDARVVGIPKLERAAIAFVDAERARLKAAARFLDTGKAADDAALGEAVDAADAARIELDAARDDAEDIPSQAARSVDLAPALMEDLDRHRQKIHVMGTAMKRVRLFIADGNGDFPGKPALLEAIDAALSFVPPDVAPKKHIPADLAAEALGMLCQMFGAQGAESIPYWLSELEHAPTHGDKFAAIAAAWRQNINMPGGESGVPCPK
jgi:hypothetical protein